ncbi:MAG: hypothetical protein WC465_01090 [Patescibacteria group bacterium]
MSGQQFPGDQQFSRAQLADIQLLLDLEEQMRQSARLCSLCWQVECSPDCPKHYL